MCARHFQKLNNLHLICIILLKQRRYWPHCFLKPALKDCNNICSYVVTIWFFQKWFCSVWFFFFFLQKWGQRVHTCWLENASGIKEVENWDKLEEWQAYLLCIFLGSGQWLSSSLSRHQSGGGAFDSISYCPGKPLSSVASITVCGDATLERTLSHCCRDGTPREGDARSSCSCLVWIWGWCLGFLKEAKRSVRWWVAAQHRGIQMSDVR